MNRFARWGFALAVLPIAACASNPPPPPAAPPGPPPLASADATFVTAAAQGGMTEIQEAQLAQKTSHSARIKAYAARMISDHNAADDQLKQLAMTKNAMLPTAVNDTQMQEMAKLQGETGRSFDHDYIADNIAGHQQQVVLFQTESQGGTDPDLKKFATDTLPTIQSHLDQATALAGTGHKGMMHHRHHKTAS